MPVAGRSTLEHHSKFSSEPLAAITATVPRPLYLWIQWIFCLRSQRKQHAKREGSWEMKKSSDHQALARTTRIRQSLSIVQCMKNGKIFRDSGHMNK